MKKKLLYLFILSFICKTTFSRGFLRGTLVRMAEESCYKEIQELKEGDIILCVDKKGYWTHGKIDKIKKKKVNKFYILPVGIETLCFDEFPIVYSPFEEKFVDARLSKYFKVISKRYYRTYSLSFDSIIEKEAEVEIYSIKTHPNHNYFVTESEILIHNDGGITAAGISLCWLFGGGIEFAGITAFIGLLISGINFIANIFSNKDMDLEGFNIVTDKFYTLSLTQEINFNLFDRTYLYGVLDSKIKNNEVSFYDLVDQREIFAGYFEYKFQPIIDKYFIKKNKDSNNNKNKYFLSAGGGSPDDPNNFRKILNKKLLIKIENEIKDMILEYKKCGKRPSYEDSKNLALKAISNIPEVRADIKLYENLSFSIKNLTDIKDFSNSINYPAERLISQLNKSEAMKALEGRYAHYKGEQYKLIDKAIPIFPGAEIITWDYLHKEIELWSNKNHLGSVETKTWKRYKGPDKTKLLE